MVFSQYLPAKSHKYGIKVFNLCSSEGYCWSLQVYGGKSATGGREVGQAFRVCKDLTVGLRNKGRTLYVDNFYTSYAMTCTKRVWRIKALVPKMSSGYIK